MLPAPVILACPGLGLSCRDELVGVFALAPEEISGVVGWAAGEKGRAFMKITERSIRGERQSK